MSVLIVVGCSATKGASRCAAGELYLGHLFTLSMEWAATHGGRVVIASAMHGMIDPSAVIDPYDVKAEDVDLAAWTTAAEFALLGMTEDGDTIIALAGAAYCGWRDALVVAGRAVSQPLEHLGIGHRKQRLAHEVALMRSVPWDVEQVDLNSTVLNASRLLDHGRSLITSASNERSETRARRDLVYATSSLAKLLDAYRTIDAPERKPRPPTETKPQQQGELFA